MYYLFDYYPEVKQFLNDHPNAKLVGWPYGIASTKHSVFDPKELPKRQ